MRSANAQIYDLTPHAHKYTIIAHRSPPEAHRKPQSPRPDPETASKSEAQTDGRKQDESRHRDRANTK